MKILAVIPLSLILTGCALQENKAGNDNSPVIQPAPVVNLNVPPVATEDIKAEVRRSRDDLKAEIQTSSNNTQSNMSGLVNASVSKLGEKVTGVEAKVEASATATANLSAKVTGIESKIDSTIVATANLNAKVESNVQATANLNARIESTMTMLNEMNVNVGKLNAIGQVGIGNKLEQIEEHVANAAGRDVNYLPKQAVELMIGIISALCGLATTVVMVLGRNARVRERQDADRERENVKYWQTVAMKAIGELDPAKSRDFTTRDMVMPQATTRSSLLAWSEIAISAFAVAAFMGLCLTLIWRFCQ